MKKGVILVGLLCCTCCAGASEKSNFTFDVPLGPHSVGFRVVHQYDYSRSYKRSVDAEGRPFAGERARPIQTLIWYPAQPEKTAKPMLYGGYLELLATEEDFDLSEQQRAAKLQSVIKANDLADNYDRERQQVAHAFRDAKAKPGPFSVVVYAPSFSAPAFENSDLCELLASHGYIVIASPDMGARARPMTPDLEGINAQVGDIEFLIGCLHQIREADMSRVAVAGFSWGGISNVFAALRDNRISALVCLDGSIRYFPNLFKQAKFVEPLTVPFLYLASSGLSPEEADKYKLDLSYSVLNEVKYSDFYLASFPGMMHTDFSSRYIRFRKDADFKDYTPAEISQSHSWMAQYVLNFLNAYLKADTAGLEFLKTATAKNSVPRHLIKMESRVALHPAPTISDFAAELAKRGFDRAIDIYKDGKKKNATFKLDEQTVNAWGYELLHAGKVQEAIAVFKLNVEMYPEKFNSYDSLAEAQAEAGDKASAISNYKKSLELNSDNSDAVEHLKKLEPSPGQ